MMAFILDTDFDFIAYMSKMAFLGVGGWGGGELFSRQWRFWNMIILPLRLSSVTSFNPTKFVYKTKKQTALFLKTAFI